MKALVLARVTFHYDNGDMVILHYPWDDEFHKEGIYSPDEPEVSGFVDGAGQTDFHPVQYMDVYSPGTMDVIRVERR
jgi:hypothetical protein